MYELQRRPHLHCVPLCRWFGSRKHMGDPNPGIAFFRVWNYIAAKFENVRKYKVILYRNERASTINNWNSPILQSFDIKQTQNNWKQLESQSTKKQICRNGMQLPKLLIRGRSWKLTTYSHHSMNKTELKEWSFSQDSIHDCVFRLLESPSWSSGLQHQFFFRPCSFWKMPPISRIWHMM